MTHTVESLMALHHAATAAALQYADCARVSLRSARSMQAADDRNEANDALRTALTEALAFNPDWADFENGRECGRLEEAQPVAESAILARGRFHAFKGEDGDPDDWEWFESGTNCEHGCVDAVIVRADSFEAAQPVREPDLSSLSPKAQVRIREWLADGTFVERAIGTMREQERELSAREPLVPCHCFDDTARRYCKDKNRCAKIVAHGIGGGE